MPRSFENQISAITDLLHESSHTVCFTGAGISTDSGIPDFRSPGGLWSRSKPVEFTDFVSDPNARYEYWRQKAESHSDLYAASPNVAHYALAAWEAGGQLSGVITQNIDGLHQDAGSREVLELHGTSRHVGCLSCDYRSDADPLVKEFQETSVVPECPHCGGLLKHATVSFGQSLPRDVLENAVAWSAKSELFLVLGSSLVVQPAAGLPTVARQHGATLVIVNRDTTPLDDLADIVVNDSIGKTIGAVNELLRIDPANG